MEAQHKGSALRTQHSFGVGETPEPPSPGLPGSGNQLWSARRAAPARALPTSASTASSPCTAGGPIAASACAGAGAVGFVPCRSALRQTVDTAVSQDGGFAIVFCIPLLDVSAARGPGTPSAAKCPWIASAQSAVTQSVGCNQVVRIAAKVS